MIGFTIRRLLSAALVVAGVVVLVFMLVHLAPGDPVDVMLGESALPADRVALRHALGLDRPVLVQLVTYFRHLLHLNLGTSLYSQQPVAEILAQRIPATAELALAALVVAVCLAFPLGILAAVRKDTRWDYGAMGFALLGVSIPNFWMGPLLILVFSVGLGWFPVSGRAGFSSLVLPAITLGTAMAAILSRMVRSALLEVLGEDYIRTARAKGLAERTVILRHGLRNALLPVLTLIGLQLGTLLGGAVITEMVFSWPGVGQLLVDAIHRRDYPVVQACVLLISVTYVVVNMLTDLVYAWADPRMRGGGAG
ncbi:MAG: nickel ABC transporter permease [Gammaproteobacteria bacterium]|nr:ABC transporter permease [Gammaproteobacteria bacterium]